MMSKMRRLEDNGTYAKIHTIAFADSVERMRYASYGAERQRLASPGEALISRNSAAEG